MNNSNIRTIKLAVQKNGRLTTETLDFLWKSGLDFDVSKEKLFTSCRNFPLEIYFMRDDDIAKYLISNKVDLGIIGQNILFETRPKVKKQLNLRYGYCTLVTAAPGVSKIKTIADLSGKKIATSYPNSTKIFLRKNKIRAKIIPISGSVEITPGIGIADAIVDLTSTGSTLVMQDLKVISKIFKSEAVLISSLGIKQPDKINLMENLLLRFKAVLSAKQYKLVVFDSPKKLIKKIDKYIPGQKLSQINNDGLMQAVIKEDILWESVPQLKKLGIKNIYLLPIEKIIN
jgi:ATP phosphoribosyltransferase